MPDRAVLLAEALEAARTLIQRLEALQALGQPEPLQPLPVPAPVPAAHGLTTPAAFFDHMRTSTIMGPALSQDEVNGCGAIMDACADAAWPIAWTAYALATTFHETAATMKPIREYGRGKGRSYGKPGPHGGQIPYGRGYVQLTHTVNYENADQKLGLNGRLIANYDLALDPDIAAQILVRGMAEGWFTGKKMADTLPASGPALLAQFKASRPIINGTDKDTLIAGYAVTFQEALTKGQWT